jgi:hypothetical protein
MNTGQALIAILIVTLLGMNIVASVKVHASGFYEPSQKALQYALIWLLPPIGAILCCGLARQDNEPHSGICRGDSSLYDDGNVGIGNGDGDYFGGGEHHGD